MDQWLRLSTPNAGGMNSIPGQEARSHIPQTRPSAAKKKVNNKEHTGIYMGFPGGSDGKESACHAEDPDSIPGSGRSPGKGNGNHSSTLA